jgi:hypothetical protein
MSLRYIDQPPSSLMRGRAVVHNLLSPDDEGFRGWIERVHDGNWHEFERCACEWGIRGDHRVPHRHFRRKEPFSQFLRLLTT